MASQLQAIYKTRGTYNYKIKVDKKNSRLIKSTSILIVTGLKMMNKPIFFCFVCTFLFYILVKSCFLVRSRLWAESSSLCNRVLTKSVDFWLTYSPLISQCLSTLSFYLHPVYIGFTPWAGAHKQTP